MMSYASIWLSIVCELPFSSDDSHVFSNSFLIGSLMDYPQILTPYAQLLLAALQRSNLCHPSLNPLVASLAFWFAFDIDANASKLLREPA